MKKIANALMWACLVLTVALMVLWPVSFFRSIGVAYLGQGVVCQLFVSSGGVVFNWNDVWVEGVYIWRPRPTVPIEIIFRRTAGSPKRDGVLGFYLWSSMDSGNWVVAPLWCVILFFGIEAALFWRETKRNPLPHACSACGYDLRGSPPDGACPECGAARSSLASK